MPRQFESVKSARPGRSVFDLSYSKLLTCDMGQLIPVMCDEMVPGDLFNVGNEMVIRYQPLVAPILHQVWVFIHTFFVPYRLLWDQWEDFITRGITGNLEPALPTWSPTSNGIGSLWDYLGFPTGVVPTGALPLDFPRRAYNLIYNEYYRDETLISEVAATNETILRRAWAKDYFTSALPWQQRGTAPALPISGSSSAEWSAAIDAMLYPNSLVGGANKQIQNGSAGAAQSTIELADGSNWPSSQDLKARLTTAQLNSNTVDLSDASTFDVADLRLAFQLQKWMERNARSGARYVEFLKAQYGTAPTDDRLQRPEYVGGAKVPVIVSEVLQTGETATTPQGNMAGHGLVADMSYIGKYHAQEFGLIMSIMSVIPEAMYQQGIDRQWLRRSNWDFYNPSFANLSEQAIERAEIYASGVEAENRTIFGYQGRYDEMRVKRNMVCGQMRDTFDYWHLGRQFGSAPTLNQAFIECNPDKRIFADQADPGLIVSIGNKIKAIRPMPVIAEPGLIDHY